MKNEQGEKMIAFFFLLLTVLTFLYGWLILVDEIENKVGKILFSVFYFGLVTLFFIVYFMY